MCLGGVCISQWLFVKEKLVSGMSFYVLLDDISSGLIEELAIECKYSQTSVIRTALFSEFCIVFG